MKLLLILVAISLSSFISNAATLCAKEEATAIANCSQIISSEIDGKPEDKIISADLKISKIKNKMAICLNGNLKDTRGTMLGYNGVTFENGSSPWPGSSIAVTDSDELLKSHITGFPHVAEQKGPTDFDQISLDKKSMLLTLRRSTGVHAFATLILQCSKQTSN